MKERDRTQMPVAKKERTDHKCLWQRKKDQTTNTGGKQKMAAKITVPTTNRWKAKLTITNSKLTPH